MEPSPYKKARIYLSFTGILSSLATVYKMVHWLYQKLGADMFPWLFIALIAIASIVSYVWLTIKERRQEASEIEAQRNKEEAKRIAEEGKMNKWLTHHAAQYDQQEFDSLEHKILYLIRHELKSFRDAIERGDIHCRS